MFELIFAKMKQWKSRQETNKNGAGGEQVGGQEQKEAVNIPL